MSFEATFHPTPDDIQAWQSQPVSRWFFQELQRLIEEKQAYMGAGNCFIAEDMARTYSENAQVIGYIAGVKAALEMATPAIVPFKKEKSGIVDGANKLY